MTHLHVVVWLLAQALAIAVQSVLGRVGGAAKIDFAISSPPGELMAALNNIMSQSAWRQDRGPATANSMRSRAHMRFTCICGRSGRHFQ